MEAVCCPRCSASTVIAGSLGGWRGIKPRFVPLNTRLVHWDEGIALHVGELHCCSSCGLTWTSLEADKVRELVEAYGDDLAVSPAACAALSGVAEIDALAQAEATRRYRELTHATWDEAINAVRDWHLLNRAEKLARFGWHPKKAPQAHQSNPLDHPMRDHWLDG
jgi:hypothetical protein